MKYDYKRFDNYSILINWVNENGVDLISVFDDQYGNTYAFYSEPSSIQKGENEETLWDEVDEIFQKYPMPLSECKKLFLITRKNNPSDKEGD